METYLAAGIVTNFQCKLRQLISKNCREDLRNYIDIDCYDLHVRSDAVIIGQIKQDVFLKNINSLLENISIITGAQEINQIKLKIKENSLESLLYDGELNAEIQKELCYITYKFLPIFCEGRISFDCFSITPKLLNHLLRHSDFGNPLQGCTVFDILEEEAL